MRKQIYLWGFFAAMIVLGVLLAGCVTDSSANQSTNSEATTIVEANNRFAFDLYSNLRNDPQNQNQQYFLFPFQHIFRSCNNL